MSCTSAHQGKYSWGVSWNSVMKWGSSSRYRPRLLYFLCSMGDNPPYIKWRTCKLYLAHLHIMLITSGKFHENPSRNEEVVRVARFRHTHTYIRTHARTSSWLQYTPYMYKLCLWGYNNSQINICTRRVAALIDCTSTMRPYIFKYT